MSMKVLVLFSLYLGYAAAAPAGERISRSFELRYFSADPKADGETDFKGPTEVFTTDERMQYLQAYARYARTFFDDPRWDRMVVTDDEAAQTLRAIKPQPLPSVRTRIPLQNWQWMGSRQGQREQRIQRLEEWRRAPGVEVVNGGLHFTGDQALNWTFDPHPVNIEVTDFLKPDQENVIAIRVRPNVVKHTMRHTASDLNTGWFAGRAWLDLTGLRHIEDVFVYATSAADPATVHVQVEVCNDDWELEEREMKKLRLFKGAMEVEFTPWFPEESAQPAAVARVPIEVRLRQTLRIEHDMNVPHLLLWTPENPQLYKVVVRLLGEDGQAVDDFALSTGLRSISQEGGTFRINGKPSMMNGPLLMPFRAPLDKIATWMRCSSPEWLIKDILMIKRTNGNSARMEHHDGPEPGGINDPRLAEYADQLGLMFQWATSSWIRTGSPWLLDFEGLPQYVRQVRNHPSIVMWQPANHPLFRSFEEGIPWLERVYEAIYPNDPSRLINPTASGTRLNTRNDTGTLNEQGQPVEPVAVWTAPMMTRGNMEVTTGYNADWAGLRNWPQGGDWTVEDNWIRPGYRLNMLHSPERAYLNPHYLSTKGTKKHEDHILKQILHNFCLRETSCPSWIIMCHRINDRLFLASQNLLADCA